MCSYYVTCDFSSLLNSDVVQFARILLTMVKHVIFRDHVDDHPRAGWSDHMDGLPCNRGGGQAAHSRQGWCCWLLRGGPFQELDQPDANPHRSEFAVQVFHKDISGQVILVTGGGSGIGRLMCQRWQWSLSCWSCFWSWQQLWWCRWWFLWRFARLGAIVVTWDINTVSEQ